MLGGPGCSKIVFPIISKTWANAKNPITKNTAIRRLGFNFDQIKRTIRRAGTVYSKRPMTDKNEKKSSTRIGVMF